MAHGEQARGVVSGPLERHGDGVADGVGLPEGVRVEERLAGDAHGDVRRLLRERQRLLVAPPRDHALRHGDHVARVTLELRLVKEGRHQLSLPAPQLAVAREQPFAGEREEREPRHLGLVEAPCALDEELVEHVGVIGHQCPPWPHLEAGEPVDLA